MNPAQSPMRRGVITGGRSAAVDYDLERVAVVQRPHRVIGVGGVAGPELEPKSSFVIGRVGVPHADDHTPLIQPPDQLQGPRQFWGHGDHLQARMVENEIPLARPFGWIEDEFGRLGPWVLGADEGTL